MASILDLSWSNCEDLFRDLDVDTIFYRQRRMLSGESNSEYPSTLLINSREITLGVNFGNHFVSGNYPGILVGDKSCPQDGPLFDWNLPEEHTD